MEELAELHRSKPTNEDAWRAYTYQKGIPGLRLTNAAFHPRAHPPTVIPILRAYPTRILNYNEVKAIRGVGDKTADKVGANDGGL